MYLHVRKTWANLEKQSTLMLHTNNKDEGSCWQVQAVPNSNGNIFTLRACRSKPNVEHYLHVRKSWNTQKEEDTLMLCHHGAGDPGSEWRLEIGSTSGTNYLINQRSGTFLHLRASWATEPKGSHLSLSPAPTADNLCAWCFEPVAINGADASWLHLRSPAAIRRVGEKDVGLMKKFAWSGAVQSFPGFSVIADVLPAAQDFFVHGRKLVEESAKGRMLLSDTLPLSSLHMTLCGFNEVGIEQTQVNQLLMDFAASCHNQQFRGCGVTVRQGGPGKAIRLDVASVEPQAPFLELRQALRDLCGKAKDNPEDGKLHVNLGWYILWEPPQEQQVIVDASLEPACAELTEALARIAVTFGLKEGEVPFSLPHLSNYPDMASFPHNCYHGSTVHNRNKKRKTGGGGMAQSNKGNGPNNDCGGGCGLGYCACNK